MNEERGKKAGEADVLLDMLLVLISIVVDSADRNGEVAVKIRMETLLS